jgi:hypothetical protein
MRRVVGGTTPAVAATVVLATGWLPVALYVMEATPEPLTLSVAFKVSVTFVLFQPAPLAATSDVIVAVGATLSRLMAAGELSCAVGGTV